MQGKTRLGIFSELVSGSSSYVELSQPLDGHLIRVNTVDVHQNSQVAWSYHCCGAVCVQRSPCQLDQWCCVFRPSKHAVGGAELAAEGAHMQCHAGSTCSDATCRVVQDPAESCDALAFAVSSRGHVPEPLDAADSALAQLAQTVQALEACFCQWWVWTSEIELSGSCSSMARWLSPCLCVESNENLPRWRIRRGYGVASEEDFDHDWRPTEVLTVSGPNKHLLESPLEAADRDPRHMVWHLDSGSPRP